MLLFFDTETTGLWDFKSKWNSEVQPNLVQLAFILTTNEGIKLGSSSLIIQPNKFEIPIDASDIHGITTDYALKHGIPLKLALDLFEYFALKADFCISHNFTFDSSMVNVSLNRLMRQTFIGREKGYCTMLHSTQICKLPKKNGNAGYKWPTLMEAYVYFFDEAFDDAHNAEADVEACKRIYFKLKEIEK
jgi:DNA polymerase III epsilon subunit-like protein